MSKQIIIGHQYSLCIQIPLGHLAVDWVASDAAGHIRIAPDTAGH